MQLEKELSKSIRQTATTFAPRSSTAKGKNPAVKGSVLYNVFEVQVCGWSGAWLQRRTSAPWWAAKVWRAGLVCPSIACRPMRVPACWTGAAHSTLHTAHCTLRCAHTQAAPPPPHTNTAPHTPRVNPQAWLAVVVGGLLSFNAIFPSDEPNVARLMGWVQADARCVNPRWNDGIDLWFI